MTEKEILKREQISNKWFNLGVDKGRTQMLENELGFLRRLKSYSTDALVSLNIAQRIKFLSKLEDDEVKGK
jgi:hypothetical protein